MGGGVYVQHSATLTLSEAAIYRNYATASGLTNYGVANNCDPIEEPTVNDRAVFGTSSVNTVTTWNSNPYRVTDNKELVRNRSSFWAGSGGGVWLCPTGVLDFDSTLTYIGENGADAQGDDFFKDTGFAYASGDARGLLLHFEDPDHTWVYDRQPDRQSNTVLTNLNGVVYDSTKHQALNERDVLSLRNSTANEAITELNDHKGLHIAYNVSRRGGGVGSNGQLRTLEREPVSYNAYLTFQKKWDVEANKPPISFIAYYELHNDDGSTRLVEIQRFVLGNPSSLLGSKIVHDKQLNYLLEPGTNLGALDGWTGRLKIPANVEGVAVFGEDYAEQIRQEFEAAKAADPNAPFYPSTDQFNVVFKEYDPTEGDGFTKELAAYRCEASDVEVTSISDYETDRVLGSPAWAPQNAVTIRARNVDFALGQALTNHNDEPAIEKYVEKDVHADLPAFDAIHTYDILAYVPIDADKLTITDELVPALELVGEPGSVEVAYKSANNKLTLVVQKADPDAGDWSLRGTWVQVTFAAKIKDSYRTLEALRQQADGWRLVQEGDPDTPANGPVLGGADSHTGTSNEASYLVEVYNRADAYPQKGSNTVTVVPPTERVKVAKEWSRATSTDPDTSWPAGVTVVVGLYQKDAQGNETPVYEPSTIGSADHVQRTLTLSESKTSGSFEDLPTLEDVTYTVEEERVNNYKKGFVNIRVTPGEVREAADAAPKTTPYTITNRYSPGDTTAQVAVSKNLTGRDWQPGETYRFKISRGSASGNAPLPEEAADDGSTREVSELAIAADDRIVGQTLPSAQFPSMTFTYDLLKNDDGTHATQKTFYYDVKEVLPADVDQQHPSKDGVSYDQTTHSVQITLADDGHGQLVSAVSYDPTETGTYAGKAVFRNAYAAEGTAELWVAKRIVGRPWNGGESFAFALTAKGGAPLRTAKGAELVARVTATAQASDPDHAAHFPALHYQLSDLAPAAEGWTYFTYQVAETTNLSYMQKSADRQIRVRDAGNGTTLVEYGEHDSATGALKEDEYTQTLDAPVMYNTYRAKNARTQIKASKEVLDVDGNPTDDWNGEEFGFVLLSSDNDTPMPANVKSRTDGAEDHRLVYSTTAHAVHVTVSDNGAGELSARVSYESAGVPVFHNRAEGGAELVLGGHKVLLGRELEGGLFTFELFQVSSETGNDLTDAKRIDRGSVTASGLVEKVIEYNLSDLGGQSEKTFHYVGREVLPEGVSSGNPTKDGVTYSTEPHRYAVTVRAVGNGKIEVSAVRINGEEVALGPDGQIDPQAFPTHTNSYASSGTAHVNVAKHIEGRDWRDGESFSFVLTGKNGAPARVKNGENAIESAPDSLLVATATKDERTPSFDDLWFTQDDMRDGDGNLVATYQDPEDHTRWTNVITTPQFDNVYEIEGTTSAAPAVRKRIVGVDGEELAGWKSATYAARVADAGDGRLEATVTYGAEDSADPALISNHESGDDRIPLAANKALAGARLHEGAFGFELFEANEDYEVAGDAEPLVTSTNDDRQAFEVLSP